MCALDEQVLTGTFIIRAIYFSSEDCEFCVLLFTSSMSEGSSVVCSSTVHLFGHTDG